MRGMERKRRRTRNDLYVLISPKRCSTLYISRLSERLAGRGWMRRCIERMPRFDDALRASAITTVVCLHLFYPPQH